MLRVFLCAPGDDGSLRAALLGFDSVWLEGECSTYDQLLPALREQPCDASVILVDADPAAALALIEQICREFPGHGVLAIIHDSDPSLPVRALRAGAASIIIDDKNLELLAGALLTLGVRSQSSTASCAPAVPSRSGEMADGEGDDVDCTVFAPARLDAGETALVQVFVHLPEASEEARQLAIEFDPASRRLGFQGLSERLAVGSPLTFTLVAPGCRVDEPSQTLRWRRRTESVQFALEAPVDAPLRPLIATVQVAAHGVPLGAIRCRIEIARATSVPPPQVASRLARYASAFVSYSSQDRDEVLKRVQMLQRLKIDVFQDVLDVEPGEAWADRLTDCIDRCDLFLLFWSTAARHSEWVAREVEHALRRREREEGVPEIVPVVLEGPPMPPPPPALAHLHFYDGILNYLGTRYQG